MNEALIDTLLIKPERSFSELILALRESSQDHVANILEPYEQLCKLMVLGNDSLQELMNTLC